MWHTLFFLLNYLTYTIIKTRLCTKLHDHATIDQIVVIASDFAMQYLTFAKNIFLHQLLLCKTQLLLKNNSFYINLCYAKLNFC
uniref:ORF86 n=1 Tax=Cnaphalocrocis medinalis granulovirus TaxID=1750712 RepID=A0A125QVW6_9BBAC|nr:ORF86 [Cnaphalocrocis medinalis granulovirus]